MKPTPQHDFPITVRPARWDVLESDAELYNAIFNVILNFTITVAFVPSINRGDQDWPPISSEETEQFNQRMARLECIEEASYAVTPEKSRSGTHEQIILDNYDEHASDRQVVIIFYVTDDQFELFLEEMIPLSEEIGSIQSYMPLSQLMHLKFVQFIIETVIESHLFDKRHKFLLGR